MLKVFVPRYDAPTIDNARLANDVFPNSPRHLVLGDGATRKSLHALIAETNTTAILIMAHGDKDCVCGHDGEVALSIADLNNNSLSRVLSVPVFAWVCRTSQEIGQVFHSLAKTGGAWWGYRTTVSAPSPREIEAFREVLQYIAKGFQKVHDERAAAKFFCGLQALCDSHYAQVVHRMSVSRDFRDAHEVAVGLRETWEHLDAMLPALCQPFHAGIKPAAVLDGV
jgi:hypothetical protein